MKPTTITQAKTLKLVRKGPMPRPSHPIESKAIKARRKRVKRVVADQAPYQTHPQSNSLT